MIIQILIAASMWIAAIALLLFRPRHSDRSLTWTATAIAASMTLNIDPVYIAADGLLGGQNFGDLIANSALIIGVFFLARGISHSYDYSNAAIRIVLGPGSLVLVLIVMVGSFAWIDRPHTSTTFMAEFGEQPAAAIYSIAQYTYFLVVMLCLVRVVIDRARTATRYLKVSTRSLLAGSLSGVVLCLTVISMDTTHLAGEAAALYVLQWVYDIVNPLTFLLFLFGIVGPPMIRWSMVQQRARRTRSFIRQLNPTWKSATAARPGLVDADPGHALAMGPDEVLHRQIVEIRDAMLDPTVSFSISRRARMLITSAEAHLLAAADPFPRGRQASARA